MPTEFKAQSSRSTVVHCDEGQPPAWPDDVLLTRMLAREERAWREFIRRFERVMHSAIEAVLKRFHSVLGSADRDDIYASLLLGLQTDDMHRLRVFNGERGVRLSTWLGVLARNFAWDFVRAKPQRALIFGWSGTLDSVPSSDADLVQALDAKQALLRVQSALPKLSRRDQRFVDLYYMEGLDPAQVSRTMRISIKTVYSKNHKLRSRLHASAEPRTFPSVHPARRRGEGTYRSIDEGEALKDATPNTTIRRVL